MKIIMYVFSFVLLIYSCNKDKSDTRKMVGTWKREFKNGMTGQLLSEDTVYIDNNHFKQDNVFYNFYLKNDSLILIKDEDTSTYCYNFITDNQFTIRCFSSLEEGLYYHLKRI